MLGSHFRQHGGLVEQPFIRASGGELRSLSDSLRDDSVHAVALLFVDQRTEGDMSASGISHRKMIRLFHQALRQSVSDRRLHQHTSGCHADLTLMQVGAPGNVLGGEVEVCVLQNDKGVLAAELESDLLQVFAGELAHAASGRRRAGEGDHLHARIGAQGLARLRAARQHGQETRRQPGVRRSASDSMKPPVTGVCASGLSTTALPTDRAGATERMERMSGKLNGEITPMTPSGTRLAMLRRPGVLGRTTPSGCRMRPAACFRYAALPHLVPSLQPRATGLARDERRQFFRVSLKIGSGTSRISARSRTGVAAQAGCASAASLVAMATSSALARPTRVSALPVARLDYVDAAAERSAPAAGEDVSVPDGRFKNCHACLQ